MLLYLALGGLTRVRRNPDWFDFFINVVFDDDLVALLAVLNVQEHPVETHVLVSNGAECFAAFARTYGIRCSRSPVSYSL